MGQRDAGRHYGRDLAIGLGAYAALLVISMLVVTAMPDSPWRFVVVALPVAALVLVVLAVWRYLRSADELQGRILLESLGIGFAGGSLITFTWGLMQNVGAPAVPWTFVFPVYAACWLVGRLVAGWRYR